LATIGLLLYPLIEHLLIVDDPATDLTPRRAATIAAPSSQSLRVDLQQNSDFVLIDDAVQLHAVLILSPVFTANGILL